jgi:hypothetical protein
VGKQNDEAFGGNTMDTQWKKVKHITLSSINTLEDFTTWLEDLRDSDTTLSQTVGTNLESLMFKYGYDEDLAREWVPMSHLNIISLLGFQYYVGLHTHLWKVATTYSWRKAELHMEQHVKKMHQICQSHGTCLQAVCSTYIYRRYIRYKGFHSYKIEYKMNKEPAQSWKLKGTFWKPSGLRWKPSKEQSLLLVEGNNISRWCISILACQGSKREERIFVSGGIFSKLKQEKKG